jgi:hypothetical protein
MDFKFTPSNGYAIVTFGLIVLLALCLITRFVYHWVASQVSHAILRYLVYSTISLCNFFDTQPSVKDILFAVIYTSANAVCIGWRIESAQELSRRCASLLATNLVVLLPGASVAADILHISLRSYQDAHSVIGAVALIEGSIHAALELTKHEWNGSIVTVTGLAVRIMSILCALRLTLPGIRMPCLDEHCLCAKLPKSTLRDVSNHTLYMFYGYLYLTLAAHL